MKISRKMNMLLAINVFMMVVVVWYGLSKMAAIGNELTEISHENIPLTSALVEVNNYQLEQALILERLLRLSGLGRGGPEEIQATAALFQSLSTKVGEELRKGEQIAAQAVAKAGSEKARLEYSHVDKSLKGIEVEYREYEKHAAEIFALVEAGDSVAAEAMIVTVAHEEESIHDALLSLTHEMEKFTEQSVLAAEEEERSAFIGMVAIAVISALLGLVIGVSITRSISAALNKANRTFQLMAENKDLTQRLDEGTDELGEMGRNFNGMAASFQDVLHQLSAAAAQLASSAEELSVVTEQSNSGVNQQKSSTEQMVSALHQLTISLTEVAQSASKTADAAVEADSQAGRGKATVGSTISKIDELASEVERSSGVIEALSADSNNIGQVLDVIQDIAEQTNLLALNAAIEAARAGDQGRGFAVVADEVRTLAQRTHESTTEIQQTIERLQTHAREAVEVMAGGREKARQSIETADEATTALTSIVDTVQKIRDMTTQIATAVEEQSAVSEELNQNIISISDVCTEVSAGSLQTAQAGTEIAQLSVNLKGMVNQFKV